MKPDWELCRQLQLRSAPGPVELATLCCSSGYRVPMVLRDHRCRRLSAVAVAMLALSGCGSNPSAPPTSTVTVTVTPPPVAAPAPIELPAGSVLETRENRENGAWVDVWQVPHAGPNALTADDVLEYLQAKLPGGRPYETPSSHLKWCRGGKNYWSWESPSRTGPTNTPDAIDRLLVQVIAGHYVEIQRDAFERFDCNEDGQPG